jgi:hypothetical protein
MPNPPFLLGDNVFESTVLHPGYNVANSGADDISGHEAFRIADNLRDMSYWSPAAANAARALFADSGGTVSISCLILDRGHNLNGVTITGGVWTSSALTTAVSSFSATIPTTPGGLPSDTNGCLTPDGVWWKTFATISGRVPALKIPALGAGLSPVVTGLYAGLSYRFPDYIWAPWGDYKTQVKFLTNNLSRGGVRVISRRLNHRLLPLSIDMEAADYPAFDAQIRPLLQKGQPWWVCLDDTDATLSSLMAPFQPAQDLTYDPQNNPFHREIRNLELEEVIPRQYV